MYILPHIDSELLNFKPLKQYMGFVKMVAELRQVCQ